MNQTELAIRFGKILIVEDVRDIRPVLIPILRKDIMRSGPRQVIAMGDKQIDYN